MKILKKLIALTTVMTILAAPNLSGQPQEMATEVAPTEVTGDAFSDSQTAPLVKYVLPVGAVIAVVAIIATTNRSHHHHSSSNSKSVSSSSSHSHQ